MPHFEEIEHTADYAMRVRGRDLGSLLVNAARGLACMLVSDPDRLACRRDVWIKVDACDAESVLVEWLNELIYWSEVEMIVFGEFELKQVTSTSVRAQARGDRVHQLRHHVKAATYHNLEIIQTEQGLEATVVFDL